eukprot:GHRR01024597.1.p1 GENE.GHRR01024597.1~~GHRR01024597.1.p1  ORF type:complete len:318 (-),score=93.41 GHRR01024597.1:789-1742(-)
MPFAVLHHPSLLWSELIVHKLYRYSFAIIAVNYPQTVNHCCHVLQLREKTETDYQQQLNQLLNWQGTGPRAYTTGPSHLPVAVQHNWTSSTAASYSNSSSTQAQSIAAAEGKQSVSSDADVAPTQLTSEALGALQDINEVFKQQLGQPLPQKALRGERSGFLSCLAAPAVAERIRSWVACCSSSSYVAQLMLREPCLLGIEPQVLLNTLEGLNQGLGLTPQECVAYVLRHVVLIGLDAEELRFRVEGVQNALGIEWEEAVKLASASPGLLMLTPGHLQVGEPQPSLAGILFCFPECWLDGVQCCWRVLDRLVRSRLM